MTTQSDLKRELADARSNFRHLAKFGSGGTFLDLGANIGEVSIRAAAQFDCCVAIEAHPDTCARAARRIEEAGVTNVLLKNLAVYDKDGETMQVSTPRFSTGASARPGRRLKRAPDGYYREVPSVGINTLLKEVSPRVVKMDIEGAEWPVLAAAEWPATVDWISIEFHGVRSPQGTARFLAADARLSAFGFAREWPASISMQAGVIKALYFVAIYRRTPK